MESKKRHTNAGDSQEPLAFATSEVRGGQRLPHREGEFIAVRHDMEVCGPFHRDPS